MDEGSRLGVNQMARAVQAGEVSAGALLEAQIRLVEQRDPQFHAYVCHLFDRARQQADSVDEAVRRGQTVGPLAGVPIAVKDIFDIPGIPTTAGMSIHRDSVASSSATVVERLEAAGATIIGKLVLTEGVYAEHIAPFQAPQNPWHEAYWSGASSSGSGVAVAAGLAGAALGSETGGSIKLPAAANGVTAVKPTWGRVPRYGVFELAATLDHIGPFARSVADAATILGVIAGADPLDATASPRPVPDYLAELEKGIEGVRIGVDTRWMESCVDPETRHALNEATAVLKNAGAILCEIDVPDVSDMIWDWFPVCAAQTALAHQATFPSRRDEYGPALAQLLDSGHALSAIDYQKALLRREEFRGRLAILFDTIDLLAIPVLAFPVPSLARMASVDDELIAGLHRFTCPFNMTGSPGVVLPAGFNSERLPIVFQMVGRHFEEALLMRAGAAYQAQTDWHLKRPDGLS